MQNLSYSISGILILSSLTFIDLLEKKIIISHLCFSQITLYWISHTFPFIICCFFLTIFLKTDLIFIYHAYKPLWHSVTYKIKSNIQANEPFFFLPQLISPSPSAATLHILSQIIWLFKQPVSSHRLLFLWEGPSSFLYVLKFQSECKPILSIKFVKLLWINPSIILEYDSKSSSCTLSPIFLNLSVI